MAVMEACASAERPERIEGRPAGGFVPIAVIQFVMAWWAYRTGAIRLRDLRAWFALWEIRERRCKLGPGGERRYSSAELLPLIGGVGDAGVRAALRRLERVGLARFSEESVTFAQSPDELLVDDLPGMFSMLNCIENSRRRIPVPRRTLLFLAGGAHRAVIATVLGVMMRCLYAKRAATVSGGRCKASWVAETFGVDLRRVKHARRHLADIGWLSPFASPQWKENRWGRGVLVNLDWSREAALGRQRPERAEVAEFSTSETPPLAALSTTESPPPCLNQTLPSEFENQKLRPEASGTGFSKKAPEPKKELPTPTLRNVLKEDLRDDARLLVLFEEAVGRGLVNGTEHAKLQFFAAAEHAAVVGRINAPGLFARLVHRGWWHLATQSDEDAASARLKRLLYGEDLGVSRETFHLDGEDPTDMATVLSRLKNCEWGSLGE